MKIKKYLVAILTVIAIIASVVCLNACGDPNDIVGGLTKTGYTVTVDAEKSLVLAVGDIVDFRQYFTVTDNNGNQIVVTEEMLDLSEVDTTKTGQFTVTLAVGNASKSITFTVTADGGNGGDGEGGDLATVLAKYADSTRWSFATALTRAYSDGDTYDEYYEHKGDNIKYVWEEDGDQYTDYISYVPSTDKYYYYSEQTDGSYEKYEEGTEDFDNWFWYAACVDLTEIKDFEFTESSGVYSAKKPNDVGNSVIGEYEDSTWTSFRLTIKNDNLATISAVMSDGDAYTYTFSKFGTVNFTLPDVGSQGDNGDDDNNGGNDNNLATILAKYADSSKWNFATALACTYDGGYEDYYEYNGNDVKYVWEEYGEHTDYISYVPSTDKYYYYSEQTDGSYEKYEEGTNDFDDWFWYAAPVNLTEIKDFEFTENNGVYSAKKPNDVGNSVIGEFTNITWTSFKLTVKSGNLATITAVMSDNTTYTYTFSKFGSITFTLPNISGGNTTPVTPVTPTGTMDKQTYNVATFDNERLQDKITKTGDEPDPAIGLPSKGKYNALVIPVQFSNKTIAANDLAKLNIAFNGDSANTGWESVHSYYYKSSYEQLDISFDIAGYNFVQNVSTFTANYNYSYYETHKATDPDTKQKYNDGDNLLLHEALSYYDDYIDFSDYDYNNDGTIDAVYLIYSAPIDYESSDSFYWAYVTWNYDDSQYDRQYDGMNVFYYLFAGLDFMIEGVKGGYTNEYYPEIDGLKVNAATYIHETGHLLGLDDYYDYDEDSGCNEGLGGADMMDATVGDQNVYSKIMLGWLTPQIVVSTQTVTIKSSQERGDAILIPLNFNNSYFCEYLLIDLYSADGVNALHASADNSYLYDGADYGVRIYHVSSSINDVYSSDYGSFTDYNNTDTNIALIKLVEADGTTKYSNSEGNAAKSDLWQAGKTLKGVFPSYTTNAGKELNFDISIDSVSATQATITITYAA